MLMPPSIAVGFLCQRSIFGLATTPQRRASARTVGVNPSASANDSTTGRICIGPKGIADRRASSASVYLRRITKKSCEFKLQLVDYPKKSKLKLQLSTSLSTATQNHP